MSTSYYAVITLLAPTGGGNPADPGWGVGHPLPPHVGGGPLTPPGYVGGGPVHAGFPPTVGGGPVYPGYPTPGPVPPGQPPTVGGGPVYSGQPTTIGGGPVYPGYPTPGPVPPGQPPDLSTRRDSRPRLAVDLPLLRVTLPRTRSFCARARHCPQDGSPAWNSPSPAGGRSAGLPGMAESSFPHRA